MRVYFENTESGRNESALLVGEVVDAAMEVSEEIEAAKVSRSKKKKNQKGRRGLVWTAFCRKRSKWSVIES